MNTLFLQGRYCSLRLVDVQDATFILKLRTDEKKSKYLNKTENDICKQIDWIRAYKVREAQGYEYYFVIQDVLGNPIGTYRLYGIQDSMATPGSWILIDGVDIRVSLESVLLMYEFIFQNLKKEKIIFDVRKDNKKVVRFHESYGSLRVGESDIDYFYEFQSSEFEKMKKKFSQFIGD